MVWPFSPTGTFPLDSAGTSAFPGKVLASADWNNCFQGIIDGMTTLGNNLVLMPQLQTIQITGATLIDSSIWSQTVASRMNANANTAGTGVNGSANQQGLSVQLNITASTGAAANYEKVAAIFIANTADPSTAHDLDAVGCDMRGYIASTNTLGRAWGGTSWAEITSGGVADGLLTGHEIDIYNNGTSQASVNTTTSKYGLTIFSYGSTYATAGILLDRTSVTTGFHHAIYMDPLALAPSGKFLNLAGKFTLDKDGVITQATASGISSPVFFQSTGGGSINYNWSNIPTTGANNDDVSFYFNFATTTGATYNGARLRFLESNATNGAQTTNMNASLVSAAGALTEQLRLYATGGLSIGNANVGTDPGVGALLATNSTVLTGLRVGFSGAPGAADRVEIGDANFYLELNTNPFFIADSGDAFRYDRAGNSWIWAIGSNDILSLNATTLNLVGEFQTDTLRIDQTPTAVGTGIKTISNGADSSINLGHYISFNANGVVYYIPCGSVALT